MGPDDFHLHFTRDRQLDLLAWFSGKSHEVISNFTIPALIESAKQGYWKKGAAVKVRASLNKQNVAARWAREVEKELGVSYDHPLREGLTNMCFGSYGRAPRMLTTSPLRNQSTRSQGKGLARKQLGNQSNGERLTRAQLRN
jgi:hypothetical protein